MSKIPKEPCNNYTPNPGAFPACVCKWAQMAHKSEQKKKPNTPEEIAKLITHFCSFEGTAPLNKALLETEIAEAIERERDDRQELLKEIERLKNYGRVESAGEYFIIKPGMQKGRIWVGSTGGEGGDFDQDELFMHIRKFYDERF